MRRSEQKAQNLAAAVLVGFTLLTAVGCATEIPVDPEGYKCDPGDVCPAGYSCVAGVCRKDGTVSACEGVSCNTPPANSCKDANTLVSYAASGTCDATTGGCSYAPTETPCAQGCADGKCQGELCAGVTCSTPPAPSCLDAQTLRTFATTGTCQSATGQCDYAPTDVTCQNGCEQGMCKDQDLCMGVTCATPPEPSCSGNSAKTYAMTGTCNPATGQCTYAEMTTACPGACAAGSCVPASKTFTQIGPRVRSRVDGIDLAPSSSGNDVMAVGPNGFAARWDGTTWTSLTTGTTEDLTSVWVRSPTNVYVVGTNGTALRFNGTSFAPLTLSPAATVDFVSVHGKDQHVLIAASDGTAWRSTDGVNFSKAPAPPSTHSYEIHQAYVGDDDRERLAGRCITTVLSRPCVLYASSATANSWFADPSATSGITGPAFTAVGPAVDVGFAFVGQDPTVYRHDPSSGSMSTTNTPTGLQGGAVTGIARDVGSTGNAVFVATSRDGSSPGALYRYQKGSAPVELLNLYYTRQVLSRNDSGGVVVADSAATSANIFRRGAVTNEALDLTEDWVDVDVVSSSGRRVLINGYADLAILDPGKSTFEFFRSPATNLVYRGVVGGTGWVLAFGTGGRAYRWTSPNNFQVLSGAGPTVDLRGGCRNSDSEAYVVGTGGKIFSFTGGASLTAMTSPTTSNLNAVVCTGAGEAFAVGDSGAVLRLSGGVWTAISPVGTTSANLVTAWASNGELYAAGDGVLVRYASGGWQSLPGRSKVTALFGLSATELYAAADTDVARFDGSNWTTVHSGGESLLEGAASQGRVLFVGDNGYIVEGK